MKKPLKLKEEEISMNLYDYDCLLTLSKYQSEKKIHLQNNQN